MATAKSQRLVLKDDPPESESALQFRLTYEGRLHSSTNRSPNAKEKHAIRKTLHHQLRKLWEVTPHLKNMVQGPIPLFLVNGEPKSIRRLAYLSENFARLNGHFVPLVTEDLGVWCGIDILFLRAGRPGKLFEQGDIDNRVSTLLDALKMPTQKSDLGEHPFPADGEDPFFCLLEDDGLVSKFSVEADTLLQPIEGGIPCGADARVVITVEIRPLSSPFGFV